MTAVPGRLCNLPPFPSVANEVLALTNDEDVDLGRLSKALGRDPAFAAEVLFLANSAAFGLSAQVRSVQRAVPLIGVERLRSLAVRVATRALFRAGGPATRSLWRHSLATASACEIMAQRLGLAPDCAHTAGLIHDIGRLALMKSYPAQTARLLCGSYGGASETIAAEQDLLHVDHGQAGEWLARTWRFPDAFHEICSQHHQTIDANDSDLLGVVKAGCLLASAAASAAIRYDPQPEYSWVVAALPERLRVCAPDEEALQQTIEDRLKAA